MTWGHPHRDKVMLLIGDLLLSVISTMLFLVMGPPVGDRMVAHVVAIVLYMLVFVACFYIFDGYELPPPCYRRIALRMLTACAAGTVICSTVFYFISWFGHSRDRLAASVPLLWITASIWRAVFDHEHKWFAVPQPLIVIGTEDDARITRSVLSSRNGHYELVGFLNTERVAPGGADGRTPDSSGERYSASSYAAGAASGAAAAAAPALALGAAVASGAMESADVVELGPATPRQLEEAAEQYKVAFLVVRTESIPAELASSIAHLRFQGVRTYPLPNFCMSLSEELTLEVLSHSWLSFSDGFDILQARLFRRAKRLADLCLASVGLVLALPLMVITAIAVKLESSGPILFRQTRVGWKGRCFQVLKFRSMRQDAELTGKPQWAAVDDRRVTRVGRITRKLHIDEIPQMINVLRGEMSFVGPRPERPEFVKELARQVPFYDFRHYVPPGVTGWAQVNYRYGASVEDAKRKLQFDLYYIRCASLLLDLRILLRTVRSVLYLDGSR